MAIKVKSFRMASGKLGQKFLRSIFYHQIPEKYPLGGRKNPGEKNQGEGETSIFPEKYLESGWHGKFEWPTGVNRTPGLPVARSEMFHKSYPGFNRIYSLVTGRGVVGVQL